MQLACPHCLQLNRVPEARLGEDPRCGRCHADLLPHGPLNLDDASFEPYAQGTELPLLIDFWAPWCGPCKSFAPHFEKALEALRGQVVGVKVNSDDNPKLSVRHRIRSIPTLILSLRGAEIARVSGAMPAAELQRWVQGHLASARTA